MLQRELPYVTLLLRVRGNTESERWALARRREFDARLAKLQAERWNKAQLYGHDPDDGVGGFGAFFLLLDEPEVYGLPPDPVVPTKHLPRLWKSTALAAGAMFVGLAAAFIGGDS